jgi:prepilin-type N-terminal cleavage/methylation domain-containing protein
VNSVKKSGFTLLEMLVAMAVTAILLVLLLNMLDSGAKLWRTNENRVDSYREARAALGIMSRDLQNALASTNSQFLLNADAFDGLPSSAVKDSNSAGAVFFLAALPVNAQESSNKSDVCQVGYFLAFDRTGASTNQSLNLYRYFRSSDATFTNLTANTLFQNATIGAAGEELLARNITGFQITAYSWTTNSALTIFTTNTLPDLVEIRVSAINQETAKRLDNNVASWTNTNSAPINTALQTFTTRIKLNKGF